jgi:DNA polymerase III epsilon subunit-like protein
VLPKGPANHKLGTLREYLGLTGGEAHRALGDVLTVLDMLRKLVPESGRTLRSLAGVPAHNIYTMPWGEHKGKTLDAIPVPYRTYLLSLSIDADLRQSLMQLRAAGI